jgi:putative flippase GtrA
MLKYPLFKYSVVGASGTIIDLLFLYILVDILSFDVIYAAIISFILAATNNFIFNKGWTFKNTTNSDLYHIKYLKFMIISIIGLLFTVTLMFFINKVLMIWYISAKIVTSIVVLLWNYYANKNWTFKVRI